MKKQVIFCISALFIISFSTFSQVWEPVKTQNGLVQGTFENGQQVFRGIPFATPPVGPLRWKAPQPATNWEGVKAVTNFAPAPYQGLIL